MRTTISALVAAIAMVVSLIAVPPAASADTIDDHLQRLIELEMVPADVDVTEFRKQLAEAAASEGLSEQEVLTAAIHDAERSLGSDDFQATARCDASDRVQLGRGKRKGDVFHSPAWTGIVNHGHTGIYSYRRAVVEAPGAGKLSRKIRAGSVKVCHGAKKMKVVAKIWQRDAAATFAYHRYRGKSYDNNFAFNKTNGAGTINCSELVWRAFKHSRASIDLDDNDSGTSILPDMIKADPKTFSYKTL